MLAAGQAAREGASTQLLEKGPRLGRKLCITGKGRCNVTNTGDLERFIKAFEPNGRFLYGAFSRFFAEDLRQLLEEQGVATKEERGGRVFPESDSALEVANALAQWVSDSGVQVRLNTQVRSVLVQDGAISGVEVFGGQIPCDALVVATGGLSYPKTGCTGDGYTWAKACGHQLVPTRAALTGLETKDAWPAECSGLSLKNVEAKLVGSDGKAVASEFGEMLFTHYGVSGPIILTLSRHVPRLLAKGPVSLVIDLKPALSPEQLDDRLVRDFKQSKHFDNCLKGLLPGSLAKVFPTLCGLEGDRPVNRIAVSERRRLVECLKGVALSVKGIRPIGEAIVTGGGVSIKDIDPRTMQSKVVSGLFFAGEVLDVDAETGGFNLQAAFSTGWVAGHSAATL